MTDMADAEVTLTVPLGFSWCGEDREYQYGRKLFFERIHFVNKRKRNH